MRRKLEVELEAPPLNSKIPLYLQIKEHLRAQVLSGRLPPGTMLPSEEELGKIYGVSRPTVRQAIGELEREGLLERHRGVGTTVAQPRIRHSLNEVLGFTERMELEGRRPSSRLLERSVVTGERLEEEVRAGLGDPGRVLKLVRLRLADGEPIMLETAFVPLDLFPGLEQVDLEYGSLYRTLRERYGVTFSHIRQQLLASTPTRLEADLLGITTTVPVLITTLTARDNLGRPVEHTRSIVRSDRFAYDLEIVLSERGPGGLRLRQTNLQVSS